MRIGIGSYGVVGLFALSVLLDVQLGYAAMGGAVTERDLERFAAHTAKASAQDDPDGDVFIYRRIFLTIALGTDDLGLSAEDVKLVKANRHPEGLKTKLQPAVQRIKDIGLEETPNPHEIARLIEEAKILERQLRREHQQVLLSMLSRDAQKKIQSAYETTATDMEVTTVDYFALASDAPNLVVLMGRNLTQSFEAHEAPSPLNPSESPPSTKSSAGSSAILKPIGL